MKILPLGAELFLADGRRMDRRNEVNIRFLQLCERV
jgi:hypothetical protein